MQEIGEKFCPYCGKENKKTVLFSSIRYDDCNCFDVKTVGGSTELILKNINNGDGLVIADGRTIFQGDWQQAIDKYIKLYNQKTGTIYKGEQDGKWDCSLDSDGNAIWYIDPIDNDYWT